LKRWLFTLALLVLGVIVDAGYYHPASAQDSTSYTNVSTVRVRGRTSVPALSAANSATFYFDITHEELMVSQNGGAYEQMAGGGGSGSPGGSPGTVQYNAAGSFGGIAGASSNGTAITFTNGDLITNQITTTGGPLTVIDPNMVANGASAISLLDPTGLRGLAVSASLGATANLDTILLATGTSTGQETIDAAGNVTATSFTGTGGGLTGIPESGVTNLVSGLAAKAPLASPTFTGTVTIPTPFTLGAVSVTTTGTQLNYLASATGTTGTASANLVFSTSPTLVTPTLGAATATSINGLTLTSSASGVFTLTAGKTFTVSNTLTLTGTDASSVAFGTGGTVLYTTGAGTGLTFPGTLSIASGKTFTVSNTITFTGTDATSFALPAASTTLAGLGTIETFTAAQTFNSAKLLATLPQFTTGINDANGNPMEQYTATASAVYGFTLTNAALLGTPTLGVTAPTAAASSVAGTPIAINAANAVAATTNAGAAAGGNVTVTGGNAARLTSGNANGGSFVFVPGTGIGTGISGGINIGGTASTNIRLAEGTALNGATNALLLQVGDGSANATVSGFTFVGNAMGTWSSGASQYALYSNSLALALADNIPVIWSSTTSATGAADIGLLRNGVGILEVDSGTAGTFRDLQLRNLKASGLVTQYDGIATAGFGVPAILGYGRQTGQTAADASVATYTVGASDGSFLISANVLVTTSVTHTFTVTCTYTDESNTSRVLTLTFSQLTGTLLTAITNVTGAGAYEGVPLHIRCKASTTITIATAAGGTYTSVNYNVEGAITEVD
jgi:hypothetical protein